MTTLIMKTTSKIKPISKMKMTSKKNGGDIFKNIQSMCSIIISSNVKKVRVLTQ